MYLRCFVLPSLNVICRGETKDEVIVLNLKEIGTPSVKVTTQLITAKERTDNLYVLHWLQVLN